MRHIVRDCQKHLETEKDCIALALYLHFTYIVLALLEIQLNSVCGYPVVAFSRSKVSM